jgi:ribosomal protein L11 methyltransferase
VTAPNAWSTLRISLPPGSVRRDELADRIDRLDALSGLLAELPAVDGVQFVDPTTDASVERPLLLVFTTPAALAEVRAHAERLTRALELDVRWHEETSEDDSWRDGWKQFYRPLRFSDRILVRPSWIARSEGDPELEIVIDPGRAFGTGLHESTQLVIAHLVRLADEVASGERPAPRAVLDLGCGSGILALAAAKLFPSATVAAVDVDPEAVDTTRENAAINGLEARLTTTTGDIDDVTGDWDWVLANIRPEALVPIAPKVLARGAKVVALSGILGVEEANTVADAYKAAGFVETGRKEAQDWFGLVVEPRDG